MELHLAVDDLVLAGAAIVVVAVLTAGLALRVQVPSLLVFLLLGMVVADDGLGVVTFDDPELAQSVSIAALVLILFEGGLTSSWRAARHIALPAMLLATVGVAITATIVAGASIVIFDISGTTAWLLGAVVASTDAAAVMSVLRGAPVPERLRALLETESGLNDPIAVLLTVGILETWAGHASGLGWIEFGLRQVGFGIAVGVIVGVGGAWLAVRAHLHGSGLFAVLGSGLAGLAYGLATQVGGSGLLAVYLVGGLLAHRLHRHRHSLRAIHEGFAVAAQMALFLLLGLQVFPSDLPSIALRGFVLAAVLVLIARPLAVLAVLPWFRLGHGAARFVSWAGLRGGVPIVLATFPLTAGYPDAELVFDIVFFVVLVSVAVQGTTIGPVAHRLGLVADRLPATATVTGLDHVEADVVELTLDESAAVVGRSLAAVPTPSGVRVSMVVRDGRAVVPDGSTRLEAGDILVVVASAEANAEAALQAWVRGQPGR